MVCDFEDFDYRGALGVSHENKNFSLESPKYDVNLWSCTRDIGPLVSRTIGYRRSVMHV